MWHTSFSERDFIDFWQDSDRRKHHRPKPGLVSSIASTANDRRIHAYWQNEPGGEFFFPNILVGLEEHFESLFAKLNAIPGQRAPLSACSRIVLLSELDSFSRTPLALTELPVAGAIALAIAEAALQKIDQTPVREINAADCQRTLAYAWSLALVRGHDPLSLPVVKDRWIEVWQLLNPSGHSKNRDRGWWTQLEALVIQSSLMTGHSSSGSAMTLATALNKKSFAEIGEWWERHAGLQGIDISFEGLISSGPKELDTYLRKVQTQLQGRARLDEWYESPATTLCALIATIAAPRSLDYLARLQRSEHPGIAFLYALYAALQWPERILSEWGGLGYRVLRDLTRSEDRWAHPTADIAYIELKALEKPGLEAFLKTCDPASGITVELMPNLTVGFEFASEEVSSSGEVQQEPQVSAGLGREQLDKLEQAIGLLTQLVKDSAK